MTGVLNALLGSNAPASSHSSEATAFLARTSGLDATHTNAYYTLIDGMVTDGDFAKLDALWIMATQDATTAVLNLVSTSFPLTLVNSPTFTADRGYAGNGTSSYINSTFAPSAGTQYTLNSACYGVYNRAANAAMGPGLMGGFGGTLTDFNQIQSDSGSDIFMRINEDTSASASFSNGSGNAGFIVGRRTTSSATAVFQDGVSRGTASGTSTSLATRTLFIGAGNFDGGPYKFSTNQFAAAIVGSGTVSQANVYSRIQAFMTTVGANVN